VQAWLLLLPAAAGQLLSCASVWYAVRAMLHTLLLLLLTLLLMFKPKTNCTGSPHSDSTAAHCCCCDNSRHCWQ
jgi:hypothetical protein